MAGDDFGVIKAGSTPHNSVDCQSVAGTARRMIDVR